MSDDKYSTTGREEVEDAITLAKSCSVSDLVSIWRAASDEWDIKSLSMLHASLYETGRINELIDEFVNN